MRSLYEMLLQYSKEDYYPMHMPGHKRNTKLMNMVNPYAIDITEIEGFDNLHHPKEILYELMQRIQSLYQTKKSYMLVNGSTVGLLAGIHGCTKKGDRVIVARNSHKAVYHAIEQRELRPVYVYPQYVSSYGIHGGILSSEMEQLLITYPDVKLIIITSPTYEGIVSDVSKIAQLAHRQGIPLLVDEAHGAHFGFHEQFPKSSIKEGADVVIQSIHKTLPAFTQSALLHLNSSLVNQEKIEKYLGIYETSSPSYLFMAGIDSCIQLLNTQGRELFEQYYTYLSKFYRETKNLNRIRVMNSLDLRKNMDFCSKHGIVDLDLSKILISVKNTNVSGHELLQRLLKEYHIQLEMSSYEYGLAMTSIADTKEGFERLLMALKKIDENLVLSCTFDKEGNTLLKSGFDDKIEQRTMRNHRPERVYEPYEVEEVKEIWVSLDQCEGKIALDYISLYPPGIPLVVPGERISSQLLWQIKEAMKQGLEVIGVVDHKMKIQDGLRM